MAKEKSKWKHNKLFTVRKNYFLPGGQLNTIPMESTDITGNPVSIPKSLPEPVHQGQGISNPGGLFGAIGSDLYNTIGGVSNVVGTIGGQLLSQEKSSGLGNGLQKTGTMFSSVPVIGNYISGALNLVGGGINALWGSKFNQENISAIKGDIAKANNTKSNITDFNTLANTMGTTSDIANFSNSFIGKDGVFSNKVSKLASELRKQAGIANKRQALALQNNAEDIESNVLRNLEANYAAFGGPMDFGGGAIGYDFMNKHLNVKELNAKGKNNSLGSLPNLFNFGGGLLTHGANFDTGINIIKNGGTHEENPYEGVPMGVDSEGIPNLVEEGEVIFNDYVFSNRLTVPKEVRKKYNIKSTKPLTFAEAATQISKESEERPNDPISKIGLEALMSRLALDQENLKAVRDSRKFAKGGHLFEIGGPRARNHYGYVRGYNGGWFGEDGEYTQSYLNKVNNMTPEQLAKAFNAQYAFYNDPVNKDSDRWKAIDKFYTSNPQFKTANIILTPEEVAWARNGAQDYKPGFMHQFFMDAEVGNTPERLTKNRYWLRGKNGTTPLNVIPWEGLNEQGQTFAEAYPNMRFYGKQERPYDEATNTIFTDYYYDPLEKETLEEVPNVTSPEYKEYPTWMRYAPAFASGIMSITDAVGLTNKPDYSEANMILDAVRKTGTYRPVDFNPIGNYLEYTPFDREFYINQMNAQAGATRRAIMQNAGLNRGAGMAALLASDYNTQGQFGQLARQAEEYNLAQRQKAEEFNRATNMFNTEGALKADMANQEAMLKARDAYLKGTLSAAELRQREKQQAAAARSANLSNFINSLGDIGRENFARNMIISDPSKYYSIDSNGKVTYKNGFNNLSEAKKRQIRSHAAEHGGISFSRGGLLTKRQRRR